MAHTILLVEDEPLILMDLQFAAEDKGFEVLLAGTIEEALAAIAEHGEAITVAVLDVSLGAGTTCFPVAKKLAGLAIPFILHSGDLDRHDENVRNLDAQLIAKPAPADMVIASALAAGESGATGGATGAQTSS